MIRRLMGDGAVIMSLARNLGLRQAVFIGLGSMLGAGVFSVFAPAAASAGALLLVGLVIAGFVAYCNATSTAQLAATYPSAGGTYLYGREILGPWWGFAAGWGFVVGKIASASAMALVVSAYVFPATWQKPAAIVIVGLIAIVNVRGITRTAAATQIIAVIVITALLVVSVALLGFDASMSWSLTEPASTNGVYGILQSAGLIFFAFAGYARIATLGEEVRNPERTIPRAVTLSLIIVFVLYVLVAVTLLATLGPSRLAQSSAPFIDAVRDASWLWAVPVVQVVTALAVVGALFALLAGISRTTLSMARHADLPPVLSRVHPKFQTPHFAEYAVAVVVCVVIALTDLRTSIGFSSFGVLLYYFVANLAASRQKGNHRRYPLLLQVSGLIGCAILMVMLPLQSIVIAVVVLAVGFIYRFTRLAISNRR